MASQDDGQGSQREPTLGRHGRLRAIREPGAAPRVSAGCPVLAECTGAGCCASATQLGYRGAPGSHVVCVQRCAGEVAHADAVRVARINVGCWNGLPQAGVQASEYTQFTASPSTGSECTEASTVSPESCSLKTSTARWQDKYTVDEAIRLPG